MIAGMNLPVIGRSLLALSAVTVLAAACMPTSDAITNRPWKLVEINRSVPVAEGAVEFDTDGRFTVRPGCNSGGGTYTIDGNRIVVDGTQLTAMACGDPADGQEQAFLAVLRDTPRFEIETRTGRLRLTAGDRALVFDTP